MNLAPGDTFYWSPGEKTVYYKRDNDSDEGVWALLHECGHALLDHTQYYSDVELVSMEVDAWEKAKQIASDWLNDGRRTTDDGKSNTSNSASRAPHLSPLKIDEDHIQDCLDSYRDWLHKRSLCPDCHLSGIQTDTKTYDCIFCHKRWKVSTERFCRPYRRAL